ncbi:MAG: hypothetical protein ACRDSH_10835 [Pseudonocardiaceae bacterium]
MTALDWIVILAGLLAYVSSLLPWYQASITVLGITRTSGVNAWHAEFGAWFSVLLLIAAGGVVLVSTIAGRLRLPASRSLITLTLSVLAFITIVVRWATFPDAGDGPGRISIGELGEFDLGQTFTVSSGAGTGLYLGLISAIAAIAASAITFRENSSTDPAS